MAPSSGCLVSPDHERAKHVSDYSSRTTGEAKDVGDAQSSAGKPALVPSAPTTTQNTEPSWDFGRKWTEDDDAEEAASSLGGLSNCSLSFLLSLLKFCHSFKNPLTTNFGCLFCGSDKLVKPACPMCSQVCSSYSTLQEHVESHLQEELQADGTAWLFSLNIHEGHWC